MPIADCGFPPYQVLGTTPPRVMTGAQALIAKGPTAAVEIGFNPGLFQPDPGAVKQAVASIGAQPPALLVEALIDTGARESCIDEELAKQLQLPLVDRWKCSGVGGQEEFDVFLGHVRIAALGFIQFGRFLGARLRAGNQPHQALLRRTVLASMILLYDGRDGSVKLAR